MARYSEQTIEDVKKNTDIREVLGVDTMKPKVTTDCPFCGAKKKYTITHNSRFNGSKCFACGEGYSNPIAAYMAVHDLNNDRFPEAVQECAKIAGLTIMTEEEQRGETIRRAGDSQKDSFCARQLEESGLKVEDVMASVIADGKHETLVSPFQPGSFGTGFRVDPKGSDMVIRYYDLHGRPMTYTAKGSSTAFNYVRVRYLNPDLHIVKEKPMKYQTPSGAPSRAYIPQYIRSRFQAKEHIDTLFLQEGEKKAEKACKHGMPSIGIQGINNIGTANSGLLQDIQDVIKTCEVRNVVLMMDSDWDDLHRNITVGDRVDKRPNSFAAAVVKFKQFMMSLRNIDIEVEAWWGHVNENTFCDKGIDDLLLNTLRSHESDLMPDAIKAMNSTNGVGQFVTIQKVSTKTDMAIRDFWSLSDHQAFFNRHRKQLESLSSFRIGSIRYKVDEGKLMPVSRYSSDLDIYSVTENEKGAKKVGLNYKEAMRFLGDSGFKRMISPEPGASSYELIQIDNGIIDRVAPFRVRDFVRDYIVTNVQDPLVQEYFYAKLDVVLADKKLEGLPLILDDFSDVEPLVQRTCYNNGQVEITPKSITPGKTINNVWRSRIVARDFVRIPIIESIQKIGECYTIRFAPAAARCEFLQYLKNTSNTYFTHNTEREVTEDEYWEWNQQIVNKITAIGYLLSEWKPSAERKVVVVQDHQMSEVGQSNGGAGKSLVGNALSKIIPQIPIAGSTFKKDDPFVFSAVTKATRNIFIDDIRANFDFKHIYPMVTGDMEVNPKGRDRYLIPVDKSPKMLVTTNHTINGATEGSTRRRIIYMEYSAWYNPDHTPVDDFHHMFFDDWDAEQWNLFDNLMAECVMYYFQSYEQHWAGEGVGAIQPPMKQIRLRNLRQEMGETFLQWAEEYYDPSGFHLNERELRSDVYLKYLEFAGNDGRCITRARIMKKLEAFCEFKGYHLNVTRPDKNGRYFTDFRRDYPDDSFLGTNDKSGGKEYFTVFFPDKKPTNTSVRPF